MSRNREIVAVWCGEHPDFSAETVGGCGQEMEIYDAYRCVDCSLWFHRDCIKKHWDKVLTQEDIDRECK